MPDDRQTEIERLSMTRLSNAESSRLTRTCIESALIALMQEKELQDISITEIVNHAGVSRTAYYRHYKSKEEILQSVMKEIVKKVVKAMKLQTPVHNSYDYWLRLFTAVHQHAERVQLLLGANFGEAILNEVTRRMLAPVPDYDAVSSYAAYFWGGAVYGVLLAWMRNGMLQSPEEMASICFQLVKGLSELRQ
ncbi:TetR/AcrR family transcriptional regulator [Paenibacillus antibioticophila]|uniref:TetR/AcrR family transcriptional regulator n=1 Tax=Paenibacillus antibioticophila TaxID=1274374 RepID=UPI0005CA679D|nr:TetR/AcrR family transcriptional regulator [Paenibacillus antibioticophila]